MQDQFIVPRYHVARICDQCGATYAARKSAVKSGKARFCSHTCAGLNRRQRVSRTCEICGKAFERVLSQIRPGWGRFCSPACSGQGKQRETIAETLTDGSVRIPLFARDGAIRAYTTVDAADADWLCQWRWCWVKGYAHRSKWDGQRVVGFRLHRQLLGLSHDDYRDIDHINRDKLDNRRANLRILPKGANTQNVPNYRGTSSRFRGVAWHPNTRQWQTRVQVNGKVVFYGLFDDEHEAAEAAKTARLKFMPFATD